MTALATAPTDLMIRPQQHDQAIVDFTKDKVELLKRTICNGATDDELELFMHACKHTGLDPFMRQIHAVKRWNDGKEVMAIQTGIDGYRLIAERTNRYMPGPKPTYEYNASNELVKATAYVKKMGPDRQWHTIDADAFFDEYVCTKRDGTPNRMWATKPHIMLAKCAEALALRKAFPAEMSGIYTSEEMEQATNEAPLKRETVDPVRPIDEQDQRPLAEIFNEKWHAAIEARGLPINNANSVLSATLLKAKKDIATAPQGWLEGLLNAVAAGKFDAALKKEPVEESGGEPSSEPGPWERFKIELLELAEAQGCKREEFDAQLNLWLLRNKAKGKEDEIPATTKKACSDALATKTGMWSFLNRQ